TSSRPISGPRRTSTLAKTGPPTARPPGRMSRPTPARRPPTAPAAPRHRQTKTRSQPPHRGSCASRGSRSPLLRRAHRSPSRLRLGPLEIYLADDTVSEIMVNAPSEVYVERAGRLERAQKGFSSPRAVLGAIERIVAPLGRHVDESSPFVDARLPDGSRVNAIIPPLALKGPALTIRKFKRDLFTAGDLVERGTMTGGMAGFLET